MLARAGRWIFPLFAAAHFIIGAAALSLIDRAPAAALCLVIVEAITFFDNLIISLGNRLGVGPRAERLNWARFLFHGTLISFLLPVYWHIATVKEMTFFGTGNGIFTLVLLMIAISLLRYTQSVNENTRRSDYEYSSEDLQAKPFPPLASIATVLIALGVSLWLGLAANFWPPFVLTAVMFLAASFPPRSWGPLATSCIEVVFSGGLLWVLFSVS